MSVCSAAVSAAEAPPASRKNSGPDRSERAASTAIASAYWPSAASLDAVEADSDVPLAAPTVTPTAAEINPPTTRSTIGHRRADVLAGAFHSGGGGGDVGGAGEGSTCA